MVNQPSLKSGGFFIYTRFCGGPEQRRKLFGGIKD